MPDKMSDKMLLCMSDRLLERGPGSMSDSMPDIMSYRTQMRQCMSGGVEKIRQDAR